MKPLLNKSEKATRTTLVAACDNAVTPSLDPDLERLRREVMPPPIVQEAAPNAQSAP